MSRYRGLNRPERGRRERPILPTYLAWNGRFHYDLRAGHGIVQPMTEEPEDRHPNDAEAERLHGRDAPALVQPADLCPPVGWWQGRDIAWRHRLDRFPDAAAAEAEEAARASDRAALWQAMRRSGAASGEMPGLESADRVVDAAIRHVGAAAAALALLPVEDACALGEQPNLPGTVDGHPNWRRRLPADAEGILDRGPTRQRIGAFAASRRNDVKL